MIPSKQYIDALKNAGIKTFSGVPCSFFQSAIDHIIEDNELSYSIAPNEGSALALCAGAIAAGSPAALMIQNSGLGNLINPLTSLNMIYGLPVLMFISGRAMGIPDEPQHEIMGRTTEKLLDVLGVPHQTMPSEPSEFVQSLSRAQTRMHETRIPFAFIVRHGTIGSSPRRDISSPYPLSRSEALRIITESLTKTAYIISTTGKASRELFTLADSPNNFYMQGSMGHASAFALGVALKKHLKKIVILDGDGALLMHMGILSSIGHEKPKNLYHIVLDNEAYESTGGQGTTSSSTDIGAVALACGYTGTATVSTTDDLRKSIQNVSAQNGPFLLRVKINIAAGTDPLPRISSAYTPQEITARFSKELL